MLNKMKFAILATGGVGGYFGGKLAQAGEDVTFIARGKHLAAILDSGLRVDSINGNFLVHPARATDSLQTIQRPDVILLAVKAWQLDEAIQQMTPLVGKGTIILPLLNGMEHMDTLVNTFGREHVIGGLCRISVFIAGAGRINHVAIDPYIAFGELDKTKSERVSKLLNVFKNISGVTAEAHDDIELAMWEKYLLICAFSGVGARDASARWRVPRNSRIPRHVPPRIGRSCPRGKRARNCVERSIRASRDKPH